MNALWNALNGSKTAIGGALVSLGLAIGILTQEDVQALQATVPTLVAAAGAAVQAVGIVHKIVKRLWG